MSTSLPVARGLRGWLRAHRWALRQSALQLGDQKLGTLLTATLMGLALALPLAFALLLQNLDRIGQTLGAGASINVYLHHTVSSEQAAALAAQVRAMPAVTAVTPRSPQQGLSELAALQGFGPVLAQLPDNPLPWVLVVGVDARTPASAGAALAQRLRSLPAVALVQDQGPLRTRIVALRDFLARALLMLAALLALAAALVVGASVRNGIQRRAREIEVLRLIGAGAAFVRRPYLYAGLALGLVSGVLAVALVLLLQLLLAAPAARVDAAWGGRFGFTALPAGFLLACIGAAGALGWLGARLASARHLATSDAA